jgi:AraC-like DNA-binding protein
VDGVELLQAHFGGRGFAPHRHDTYGIAVTDLGVQSFDYRGRLERSLPGQVTVLHPDELHDGRAGTELGFGYRIVYVAPALIGEAARAITGRATPLPFVREAVGADARLATTVLAAFAGGIREPLARDGLIARLAAGLLAADPSAGRPRPLHVDPRGVSIAREYLEAQSRVVASEELESVTGFSRYELARQFRAAYGTSPYRYSLLRRLDLGRDALARGEALAQTALNAGFADQAHFTRRFTQAFGMPPGRWAQLHAAAAVRLKS